jgi:hypothetical protein
MRQPRPGSITRVTALRGGCKYSDCPRLWDTRTACCAPDPRPCADDGPAPDAPIWVAWRARRSCGVEAPVSLTAKGGVAEGV